MLTVCRKKQFVPICLVEGTKTAKDSLTDIKLYFYTNKVFPKSLHCVQCVIKKNLEETVQVEVTDIKTTQMNSI